MVAMFDPTSRPELLRLLEAPTGSLRRLHPIAIALLIAGCPGDGGDDGSMGESGVATAGSTGAMDSSGGPLDTGSTGNGPTTDGPTATGDDSSSGEETSETTGIPETCGDGEVQPPEACDDANPVDADGCNTDCTVSGSVLFEHSQASMMGTDRAFGVGVDSMGNAYVGGEIAQATTDAWLRRYGPDDSLGFTLVVDAGASDGVRGVAARSSGTTVSGYLGADLFVRSYDDAGNQSWADVYNGPANGGDVGHAIAVDAMGNAIVAGHHTVHYFDGVSNIAHNDVFVRKYGPTGAVSWTQTYGGPINTGQDQARGVATDGAGNVIVAGWESVSGAGRNVWVRKYDPAGGVLWTQGYAGPEGLDDWANAVAVGPDDTIVVAGLEQQMVVPNTLWMRKYDPDGNELWTEAWPGDTSEGAQALGVAVDDAGDIVTTGQAVTAGIGDLFVRKHDPDGNLKWSTVIPSLGGANGVGRDVTIAPNQRVWVVGERNLGVDGPDIYVARLAQ